MKKTTFIIIGTVAVILLFAIWLYLLIYGAPKQVTDIFTNFSGLSSETPVEIFTLPEEVVPTVDVATTKLKQLTTKPVIGFRDYQSTTTEPKFVRYAEAGTGHIYQINLESGVEERLSNTTIINAGEAEFSPNGKYVAIRSGYTNQNELVLLELQSTGESVRTPLVEGIIDFTFSRDNELLYSIFTTTGISGKSRNSNSGISRTLFTVPFQAATIQWSTDSTTPHYVYPKATTKLQGYLYAIKNGVISRERATGPGLTAEGNALYITYTTSGTEPVSYVLDTQSGSTTELAVITEPHKCALGKKNTRLMYCGYEITQYGNNFPDSWYKGNQSFSDRIWRVELDSNRATQLVSPIQISGREVDITDMTLAADEQALFFRNKNDNTLWHYDI
jgi:hypothetical protein